MRQMTRKESSLQSGHWTVLILVLIMTEAKSLTDHGSTVTSRPIITVRGLDQARQLTTYHVIDNVDTSPLEFGFPAEHRRNHRKERMEIVYSSSSNLRNTVIKTTLRHPYHDVYMTSDENNRVRACAHNTSVVAMDTNDYICPQNLDVYFERWDVSQTCSDDDNVTSKIPYKIRFGDNATNESQIAYASLNEMTWELRTSAQNTLIIQALAIAGKRAWEESLNSIFEIHVSRYKIRKKREKRKRRKRRCVTNPIEVRDRLVSEVTANQLRRDLKHDLQTNTRCSRDNLWDLVGGTSWGEMTDEIKVSLACSINHVTKKLLRRKLLHLASTKCVRKKKWGSFSERRRKMLLDRFLKFKWLRHRPDVDEWLISIMQSFLDSKTTTFCIEEN